MSEQYTISAVAEKPAREYDDKVVYHVRLNGVQAETPNQAFELHKKKTSKPPESGHRLDVKTFQKGEFQGTPFVKIITDYKAGQSGGYSGGGSQGSDERGESIERQVAAKVAGEMAAATPIGDLGPVAMVSNFEGFFDAVIAKIQAAPQSTPTGGGEVPADMTGLGNGAPQTADESLPF